MSPVIQPVRVCTSLRTASRIRVSMIALHGLCPHTRHQKLSAKTTGQITFHVTGHHPGIRRCFHRFGEPPSSHLGLGKPGGAPQVLKVRDFRPRLVAASRSSFLPCKQMKPVETQRRRRRNKETPLGGCWFPEHCNVPSGKSCERQKTSGPLPINPIATVTRVPYRDAWRQCRINADRRAEPSGGTHPADPCPWKNPGPAHQTGQRQKTIAPPDWLRNCARTY